MIETIARPWRGGVPLNPRTALSDLIAHVFSAPFAKTFSAPLGGAAAAAAIPWYLSGGIAAANCIGAYDAKNAASYAASLTNLANAALPLIEVSPPTTTPTWAGGTGWTSAGTKSLDTSIKPTVGMSMLVRYSGVTSDGSLLGASDGGSFCFLSRYNNQYHPGYRQNSSVNQGISFPASGICVLSGPKIYENTTLKITLSDSGTMPNLPLHIFDRYYATFKIAASIQEIAIYDILIDSYLAVLITAMAAL